MMKGIVIVMATLIALLSAFAVFSSDVDPFALAMAVPIIGTVDKAENRGIRQACAELSEIIKVLDKPRPTEIIQQLPDNTKKTLKELVEDTDIPQSTLHDILNVLWDNGLVYKTMERPAKYGRTEFLEYVLSIGEKIERRTVENPFVTQDDIVLKKHQFELAPV